MLSQRDYAMQLIDHAVSTCKASQMALSSPYFARGVEIVRKGGMIAGVDGQDGLYLVTSESDPGVKYQVTAQGCTCKSHPPEGILCKHQYAVKLAEYVAKRMQATSKRRHEHHWLCGHGSMICWEKSCPEPWHTMCPQCSANSAAEHQSGPLGCAEDCPACQHDEEEYQARQKALESEVEQARIKARLDAQMYEAAPALPPVSTVNVHAQPMPEAPASLNLKIRVGEIEFMYTLRSMKVGVQADQEITRRLPQVLALLQAQAEAYRAAKAAAKTTKSREQEEIEMEAADEMRYEH